MDNIGRPSKDHLLRTGQLVKIHDELVCGGITETTMTSVEVWQCGRPTNQWRLYRDQHGVDRVIPEPNPSIGETDHG